MSIKKISYNFSTEKNRKLIKERNISFEEIIAAIDAGCLIDVVEHPNREKYFEQKVYVVEVIAYIFLVPFVVEKEGLIFLKTIIPSRKATRIYLRERE